LIGDTKPEQKLGGGYPFNIDYITRKGFCQVAKQIFKLIFEFVKLLLIAVTIILGTTGAVSFLYEGGNNESEIEPTKPLSAEHRAEIEKLYSRMAADLKEINAN